VVLGLVVAAVADLVAAVGAAEVVAAFFGWAQVKLELIWFLLIGKNLKFLKFSNLIHNSPP
jgi:hypothetical protein